MPSLATKSEAASQEREVSFQRAAGAPQLASQVKDKPEVYRISFASEEYVLERKGKGGEPSMWLRLSHEAGAYDFERINTVGPLLADHDDTKQIGVIDFAFVENRRSYADVRFSDSQIGQDFRRDVDNGIRSGVSPTFTGTAILDYVDEDTGDEFWTAVRWSPNEISIVSKPADITVGFGRKMEDDANSPANAVESETVNEQNSDETDVESSRNESSENVITETDTMPPAESETSESQIVELNADERRMAQFGETSRQVLSVGFEFNRSQEAAQYLNDAVKGNKEISVEDFQRSLLKSGNTPKDEAVTQAGSESAELGMSDKEVQQFSFCRMLRAFAHPMEEQFRKDAAFELEVSRSYRDKFGITQGDFSIPYDILQRDVHGKRTVAIGGTGSNLVATNHLAASFIDNLRNASILMQRVNPMTGLVGNLELPSQESSTTAYWLGEDDQTTASDPTFGNRSLTPHNLGVRTSVTRSQILQSSIDIEARLRRDLGNTGGLEIDRAGIYGTGGVSDEPEGFANLTGINAVDLATASQPTWGEIVDCESLVDADNALMGDLGYMMNPLMRGYLKKTEKFSGTGGQVLMPNNNELNGYRADSSNQILATDLLFANFADIEMGMWGGIDIIVDPYTNSDRGRINVQLFQSVDFAFRHPESFCLGRLVP